MASIVETLAVTVDDGLHLVGGFHVMGEGVELAPLLGVEALGHCAGYGLINVGQLYLRFTNLRFTIYMLGELMGVMGELKGVKDVSLADPFFFGEVSVVL